MVKVNWAEGGVVVVYGPGPHHVQLGFKKLCEHGTIPTRSHEGDAGMDLYASEDMFYSPGTSGPIGTSIAADIHPGFELQVRPRSGLAAKHI